MPAAPDDVFVQRSALDAQPELRAPRVSRDHDLCGNICFCCGEGGHLAAGGTPLTCEAPSPTPAAAEKSAQRTSNADGGPGHTERGRMLQERTQGRYARVLRECWCKEEAAPCSARGLPLDQKHAPAHGLSSFCVWRPAYLQRPGATARSCHDRSGSSNSTPSAFMHERSFWRLVRKLGAANSLRFRCVPAGASQSTSVSHPRAGGQRLFGNDMRCWRMPTRAGAHSTRGLCTNNRRPGDRHEHI